MGRVPLSQRGLSLAECVISCFILVGSAIVLMSLFHASLRHATTIHQEDLAGLAAQRALESVRAWASTPGRFETMGAVYGAPVNVTFPEHPGLTLEVQASAATDRRSPCTALQQGVPLPVEMGGSLYTVRVRAPWAPGRSLDLVALVGEPERIGPRLTMTTAGTSVGQGLTLRCTASLDDATGPIQDVVYRWYVDGEPPTPGNAQIAPVNTGNGKEADLTHQVVDIAGNPRFVPGLVRVKVRAVYRGTGYEAESGPIQLL